MRTDRQKDLDRYYNDHLKTRIIRRVLMINSWTEIKAVEAAVWEALDREDTAEKQKLEEFEEWKKNQEKEKA